MSQYTSMSPQGLLCVPSLFPNEVAIFLTALGQPEEVRVNFERTDMHIPPITHTPAAARQEVTNHRLREAAIALEAGFLTEMLKCAKLGEASSSFGGGAGENQFSSFLVRAQADQIARSGGIGLSEALYQSLKAAHDE